MYATENFKTKKALKSAVLAGFVGCFQPGPYGPNVSDGWRVCEGPHFPQPHTWYAQVLVENGNIIKVR